MLCWYGIILQYMHKQFHDRQRLANWCTVPKAPSFLQSKQFTADLNMNSIARIARTSATMAKRANVARTFVSTPKALGGAKHDAHAHGDGHDDHEHHDHPVRSICK